MAKLDLALRNGGIVTAFGLAGLADIGILDGKIVQIGGEFEAEKEIDAREKLILPGGVDAHVHLSIPPQEEKNESNWVDNFESGSRAALAGGITTIGNITFPKENESLTEMLIRESMAAREQIIADLFLHPFVDKIASKIIQDIPLLLGNGCNSIKIFTNSPSFDSQMSEFLEAVRLAGKNHLVSLFHCEDFSIIEYEKDQLLRTNKSSIRFYAESRPIISEVIATQRAVAFCEVTGAPIYIVHLSSARALDVCAEAQSRNLPIFVETRPMYLYYTRERFKDEDGAKFVGQPPLREQEDINALWKGISQGVITTICSDHAAWLLASKLDPAHTISNVRPGVADLQTMIPVLYSEGVRTGRISLGKFVELVSTNASKIFGLFPQKGTIAIGSDADLVVFDPHMSLRLEKSMLISNSDYSLHLGQEITGWPLVTLRRGEIVYQYGKVIGKPGSGIVLRCGPFRDLNEETPSI